MSGKLRVDIVSAERQIASGEASMVFAPVVLGEVGIAPGHAPLIAQLGPGDVRLQYTPDREEVFYVSGGLIEVQPDVVTILSDTAERAEDLDEIAVSEAKKEAERRLHEPGAAIDYARALAEHAELVAQLRAIRRGRKK